MPRPIGKRKDGFLYVSIPSLKNPRAVRYAWKEAPKATLFNSAGLPAAPFLRKAENPKAVSANDNARITINATDKIGTPNP